MAAEPRGWVGGWQNVDSLHLLQNVIPDVPFCPARAGERAEPNNHAVRPSGGSAGAFEGTSHGELLTIYILKVSIIVTVISV